jgi:hypothetical protein
VQTLANSKGGLSKGWRVQERQWLYVSQHDDSFIIPNLRTYCNVEMRDDELCVSAASSFGVCMVD